MEGSYRRHWFGWVASPSASAVRAAGTSATPGGEEQGTVEPMAYSWERVDEVEKAAILRSISTGEPAPPPRVVEISWQDRCNIDCFFCSTADVRAGNRELSRERLDRLFDEMRALGVRGVRLV